MDWYFIPKKLFVVSLQGFSLQPKPVKELRFILHVQQQQYSQLSLVIAQYFRIKAFQVSFL